MKEIPKKWYVLYKNREEFDSIVNYFKLDWYYHDEKNLCGYYNIDYNNHWVHLGGHLDKKKLDEYGAVKITFEQFINYIVNEKPLFKESYTYLIKFFKKLGIK